MRVAFLAYLLTLAAHAQDPGQLFREAVEAQQRGNDAVAIRKYQELVKLRPDVMEVRANLGAVLAKQGRYDEAVEQYRAALTKAPQNPALRMNLGLAFYKKGAFNEAAKEFEGLAKSGDVRVVTLLGDCYFRLGRHSDVIALLSPLERAHADDTGMAWILGSALIHAGKSREGLDLVEIVAARGNNAEAHLLAGQTALKLVEFEKARDHADAALKLNPSLPGALTLRGSVAQYLGDNAGAIERLRKAVAANDADFEAHLNLAAVLRTERELVESRKHLERALSLNPGSNLGRYEQGRLERTEGKTEAAVATFERVVKEDPSWAQPHLELSALYFKLGRKEDGERERGLYERLSSR